MADDRRAIRPRWTTRGSSVPRQLPHCVRRYGSNAHAGHEATTLLALGQAIRRSARHFHPLAIESPTAQACAARRMGDEPVHAVLACKKILHTTAVRAGCWRYTGSIAVADTTLLSHGVSQPIH